MCFDMFSSSFLSVFACKLSFLDRDNKLSRAPVTTDPHGAAYRFLSLETILGFFSGSPPGTECRTEKFIVERNKTKVARLTFSWQSSVR